MGMMSLYDLIQGENIVLIRTASCWSVYVYPGESHDWLLFCLALTGQFRSHDLIKLPLQFSPKLSSSGVIIFLKTRIFFGISVWFLFYRIWRSYFFINWQHKGVNYLKIRGVRGVLFKENTPWDMDNIGKKCRLPFVYTCWLILN